MCECTYYKTKCPGVCVCVRETPQSPEKDSKLTSLFLLQESLQDLSMYDRLKYTLSA